MKLSRMIELLEKVKENHGDVEVMVYNRTQIIGGLIKKISFSKSPEYDFIMCNNAYITEPCCVIQCTNRG